MMLLAVADPRGTVVGTDVAIARRLNMPLQTFQTAIAALLEPDPDSNSPEHEGRRIIRGDGERGYQIVNYLRYRNTRDEDHRREYMRTLMADKRKAQRSVSSVSTVSNGKQPLAQADPDPEAEAKADPNGSDSKSLGMVLGGLVGSVNGAIGPSIDDALAFGRQRYPNQPKAEEWIRAWHKAKTNDRWQDKARRPIAHWQRNMIAYVDAIWRKETGNGRH